MKCLLCNNEAIGKYSGALYAFHIDCPNCKSYLFPDKSASEVKYKLAKEGEYFDKKALIAGYINEVNENGNQYFNLTADNIKDVLNSGLVPQSIQEKLNRLILKIYKRTTYIYEVINLKITNTAYSFSVDINEYSNQISALQDKGLIKIESGGDEIGISLTLEGIEYSEKLKNRIVESKQCFVAMWFAKEMNDVFVNCIKKATEECGYNALIISMKEHNDNINDQIIAEIRKSKFVIADFTGNRGGVYFEAGFGLGLGKQVIWTCRDDYFNKIIKKTMTAKNLTDKSLIEVEYEEEVSIHFDIEHYNFIVWKDMDELYIKLKNRIEATIIE